MIIDIIENSEVNITMSDSLIYDAEIEGDAIDSDKIIGQNQIEKIVFSDCEDNYPDGTKFKTGQVAEFLGKSDQVIRNYLRDLGHLVDIETTSSGTRYWSKSNIKRFREILQLKERYNWTINETAEKLSSPSFIIPTNEQGEERLGELSIEVRVQVQQEMEKIMVTLSEREKSLFERINDCYTKALTESISSLALPDKNEEVISKLNAMEDSNQRQIDALTKQLEEERLKNQEERRLEKENNDKVQQLLLEEITQMRKQIDAMSVKKKRWFGLFDKKHNDDPSMDSDKDN